MKLGFVIRAYQVFETDLNRNNDLTGSLESMSTTIKSSGR